ncbi:unnamed protein product [Toxocara canis]|uniref:H/ACA ribonucleoprotein complex non-core subunit NAF1 n=1 Tax=Toxocara canis TaxID=6265 RepID=A0A183V4Q5_TOXCA|nr:unnamed protein product [Toxocara canis]
MMSSDERTAADVLKKVLDKLCDQRDECSMMSSDERIAADVLKKVLDNLCDRCSVFDVQQQHLYAVSRSFRILAATRARWKGQTELEEDCEEIFTNKRDAFPIEHEYDGMPAIEQLTIHVDDDLPMKPLGNVTNVVDCLVVVQAGSNIALDFDTVLFDGQRNAVGKVYDIFGAVSAPLYAVRFNTPEEARTHEIGMAVFYAPTDEQFTHHIFTEQLRNEKIVDPCWDGEGDCPDDELAFSDDESEKRYLAKHRRKKVATSPASNKEAEEGSQEKRRRDEGPSGHRRGRGARRGGGGRMSQWSRGFSYHGRSSFMAWPPSAANRPWPGWTQWQSNGALNGSQPFWNGAQNFVGDNRKNEPTSFQTGHSGGYNPAFGGPPRFANSGYQRFETFERQHMPPFGGQFAPTTMGQLRPSIEFVDSRLMEH